MKGHEYNGKQHDYYVKWHDYTVKRHEFHVKQHDYCAAKALFSCPAIISQRLEPRITSNEPLENTEEESKII